MKIRLIRQTKTTCRKSPETAELQNKKSLTTKTTKKPQGTTFSSSFATQFMLDSIITSKTRIKLLLKFFLNSTTKSYLRNLEKEFGESTNGIRVELNRMEKAGLLVSNIEGNKKYFKANVSHPLFNDIHNIIIKNVGIDRLIEQVLLQIGNLEAAYITGDFAIGIDAQVIDLILIGKELDTLYIDDLVLKAENLIERKIRTLILTKTQMTDFFNNKPTLLIWKEDKLSLIHI